MCQKAKLEEEDICTDKEEGFSQKLIDVVGTLIFYAVDLYLFATSLM